MTTVELLVVVTILAVALNMMLSGLVNAGKLAPLNRETGFASDAAREVVEEMRSVPLAQVFALYNADPSDDPGGPGTAPGAAFDVAGLQPQEADPDQLEGTITFPTLIGELREDSAERDLGMPRDLNLDGVQDNLDHAGDYAILPFSVRIDWKSKFGQDRYLTIFSTLTTR